MFRHCPRWEYQDGIEERVINIGRMYGERFSRACIKRPTGSAWTTATASPCQKTREPRRGRVGGGIIGITFPWIAEDAALLDD